MTSTVPSLRWRIILGTSVSLTLVVAIGAIAVWLAAQAMLYRELDNDVRERARLMSARIAARPDPARHQRPPRPLSGERRPIDAGPLPGPGGGGPRAQEHLAGPPGFPPEMREGGTVFIQLVDPDGRELARSPSLGSADSLSALLSAKPKLGEIHSATLHDKRLVRLVADRLTSSTPAVWPPWLLTTEITPARDRPLMILTAIDASSVVSDLQRLGLVLAGLWLITTALGLIVALWLHRAILLPLTKLAQEITALGPDDLHARLADAQVPAEMQMVPQRLNDLLTRLEDAFLREKATLANLAHELRTPITGLRMTLELALAEQPPSAQATALTTCLRITESMQGMITNLLALAKLDAGQVSLPNGETSLEEATRNIWARLATRASERALVSEWHVSDILVRVTDEQAQMVIGNLLDNAVSYAATDSAVVITIDQHGGQGRLMVENRTSSDVSDVSQVFVPFWRGDQARTGGLHCGLGLALVQRLVTALGGSVVATVPEVRRFRMTVLLPLAPEG